MKDSLLLYRSEFEALLALDSETGMETLRAFYDYGLNGKEPACTGTALALFIAFKPLIDRNAANYENGKRGGRPKKENRTETELKPNNNRTETEPKPKCKMINDKCEMLNDKSEMPNVKGEMIKEKSEMLKGKDILSDKSDSTRPVYPYREIIEYLNSKAGTNYRYNSKDTRKHIKARFDEGFTLDDFKAVIDRKVVEWGNNPEMAQYLRPSTLFGTKFESYLNQKTVQPFWRTKEDRIKNRMAVIDSWLQQENNSGF